MRSTGKDLLFRERPYGYGGPVARPHAAGGPPPTRQDTVVLQALWIARQALLQNAELQREFFRHCADHGQAVARPARGRAVERRRRADEDEFCLVCEVDLDLDDFDDCLVELVVEEPSRRATSAPVANRPRQVPRPTRVPRARSPRRSVDPQTLLIIFAIALALIGLAAAAVAPTLALAVICAAGAVGVAAAVTAKSSLTGGIRR